MAYKTGDKVSFLHEKGEGIITYIISAHKVVVELTEGIEIEVDVKELVAANPMPMTGATVKTDGLYKAKPQSHARAKPHAKDVWVVDLHAEQLEGHSYSQSNQQKLSLQLNHFQECLEKALRSHLSKIVFVHGVGNGVLRQSIRDILKRYDGIEFSDGSYQKYGAGATEVRIISRNRFKESF